MNGEKMLEKLGVLNRIPYKQCNNVKPSESHLFAAIKIEDVIKISNEYNEMLEALIQAAITFEEYAEIHTKKNTIDGARKALKNKEMAVYLITKIELATGKTWEEIKGVLNE